MVGMTARRPNGRRGTGGATRPSTGRPAGARPGRPGAAGRPGATARPGPTGRPGPTSRPGRPQRPAGPTRPSTPRASAPVVRSTDDGAEEAAARPTVTLRSLGLFVVLLVAFIVLAPTLRHAVEQQEELRQLRADIEAVEERNAALELELEQWQDDTFVQAQARDRLGYVMPGEQTFRVVDPETVVGEEVEAELEESGVPGMEDAPWYLALWESVTMAGDAAVGEEPPPEG